MKNIVDQKTVLVLNAGYVPIGIKSVKEAILAMNSADGGAAVALDIQFAQVDGVYNFDAVTAVVPTKWEDWIKVECRPFDEVVHSAKLSIRVPHVIVTVGYRKVPLKRFKPNKKSIYQREGGKCAYTGKPLSYHAASLDHIMPRSRGGKDTFQNLVLCSKDINFKKADMTPAEAGLRLLVTPREPNPVPFSTLIKEAKKKEWEMFLFK